MKSIVMVLCAGLLVSGIIGCATAPKSEEKREDLMVRASDALKQMKAEDAGLDAFLSKAHGYVVFPEVGKGGYIVRTAGVRSGNAAVEVRGSGFMT